MNTQGMSQFNNPKWSLGIEKPTQNAHNYLLLFFHLFDTGDGALVVVIQIGGHRIQKMVDVTYARLAHDTIHLQLNQLESKCRQSVLERLHLVYR